MTPHITNAAELLAAGDELAEVLRTHKATFTAAMTARQLNELLDALHKWNVASLTAQSWAR